MSEQVSKEQAQKIAEALKAQRGPVITSANQASAPVNKQEPTPEFIEVDGEEPITAKPLVDPDFTKIRPRNPQHSFYWGNRVANGGMRIEDLKARGFRIAKPEDVLDPPQALIKDGHIIRGDLMLLVIGRREYLGQQLYNAQQAEQRVSRQRLMADGNKNLQDDLRDAGGLPSRHRGKIAIFQPDTI